MLDRGRKTARSPFTMTVAAAVALGIAGGAAWSLAPGQTSIRQVGLESSTSAGIDPFLLPVGEETGCDADDLVNGLQSDPGKARAWAEVFGMSAEEIPGFVQRLVPDRLDSDTPVVNHGYKDGAFVANRAVLQAGTDVLMNDRGEPAVKCLNGNPLTKEENRQAAGSGGQTGGPAQPGAVAGGQTPGSGGSGGGGQVRPPTVEELKAAADTAHKEMAQAKKELHDAMEVAKKAWTDADNAKAELDKLIAAGASPGQIEQARKAWEGKQQEAKKADEEVRDSQQKFDRSKKKADDAKDAYEKKSGKTYEPPEEPQPKSGKQQEPEQPKTLDVQKGDEVEEDTTPEQVEGGTGTAENEQEQSPATEENTETSQTPE